MRRDALSPLAAESWPQYTIPPQSAALQLQPFRVSFQPSQTSPIIAATGPLGALEKHGKVRESINPPGNLPELWPQWVSSSPCASVLESLVRVQTPEEVAEIAIKEAGRVGLGPALFNWLACGASYGGEPEDGGSISPSRQSPEARSASRSDAAGTWSMDEANTGERDAEAPRSARTNASEYGSGTARIDRNNAFWHEHSGRLMQIRESSALHPDLSTIVQIVAVLASSSESRQSVLLSGLPEALCALKRAIAPRSLRVNSRGRPRRRSILEPKSVDSTDSPAQRSHMARDSRNRSSSPARSPPPHLAGLLQPTSNANENPAENQDDLPLLTDASVPSSASEGGHRSLRKSSGLASNSGVDRFVLGALAECCIFRTAVPTAQLAKGDDTPLSSGNWIANQDFRLTI